ncbi:hypothetical protein LSAT2_003076 [Lamellibrachia satsuma]|nr:hypothetical protein LSAT2_003076 [Lamellibrachia satsuma]
MDKLSVTTSPVLSRLAADVSRIHVFDPIKFPDDFEEYRARATSGGSLYGLFRRQALANAGAKPSPERRKFRRQRSRSLIPRSTPLEDDRSILHALYDYAEAKRYECEPRRHTAACIDANHLQVPPRVYAPLRRQRRVVSPPSSPTELAFPPGSPGPKPAEPPKFVIPEIRLPDEEDAPDEAEKDASGELAPYLPPPAISLLAPSVPDSPPSKTIAGRRRSFAMTHKGLINEGDIIINSSESTFGSFEGEKEKGGLSRRGSLKSNRSVTLDSSDTSTEGAAAYSVLMLGGPGVGKTALTQQFLTSEYQAAQNTSFGEFLKLLTYCE